jgi:tripartite-type tricarboxylate transporter receptor subunit TctC
MSLSRRDIVAGGMAASFSGLPGAASAQQGWPNQPVKMIVSQAAGGAPDVICRLLTDRLARALGQNFVVENRTGAGNVIGVQMAARAVPDGYTFLWATAAALTTNVFTVKNLPYDPQKDFVTVARVARGPFVIVANKDLPANTLPEVIAMAKAKPGELNLANDGPRNFSGLVAAWLNKNAGVSINPVAYATMPQGVQDTVGGRVQLAILAFPAAAPMLKGGLLKPIAVSSKERVTGYENIPPIADTIPGFDFYGWLGVSAPAGVPRPILEKLNAEISKLLDEPEFKESLVKLGFYSFGSQSIAAAEQAVRDELALWKKVISDLGIQPE